MLKRLLIEAKHRLPHPGVLVEASKCRALVKNYRLGDGYKRIYHYHIRKTGGTSLNQMFLALSGQPGQSLYNRLHEVRPGLFGRRTCAPDYRLVVDNKVYVGWNKRLIEQGFYFYAFSHLPAHKLRLPERTFTVTCLREPVSRVLSLYNMLLFYRDNDVSHPGMVEQGPWLGRGFCDFLSRVPREHLLCQLYMFSNSYSADEAFDGILSCSHFFFTEDFSQGVKSLSEKLGFTLQPIHIRKADRQEAISAQDMERLRTLLEPEFLLYEKLRAYSRIS